MNASLQILCICDTSLFEGCISRTRIAGFKGRVVFSIDKILKILFYSLQVILSIEEYYSWSEKPQCNGSQTTTPNSYY